MAQTVEVMKVMQNDSLAAELAKGHDYKRSLAGDDLVEDLMDGTLPDTAENTLEDTLYNIEQKLSDFFSAVPWQVWAVVALVLLALFFYRLYERGLLGKGFSAEKVEVDEADNIYEIDFNQETDDAVARGDYAALVRLVYLRTLRSLDEAGRIVWRIYKTPSQYGREVGMSAFNRMTKAFVRVRYGKYPAGKALYEQMLVWQRQVLEGGAS